MSLRKSTMQTFERLKNATWFSRLGQNLIDSGEITVPVTVVSSWDEAIRYSDNEWEWLLNECSNMHTEKLARISIDEYRNWNQRVREVKLVSKPLVKSRMEVIQQENNLPKKMEDYLHWIIMGTLMEAEYIHLTHDTELGYLSKLSFWVVNGHYPCGWKGEFPNGNLIIY